MLEFEMRLCLQQVKLINVCIAVHCDSYRSAVPQRTAEGRCHAEALVLQISSRPFWSRLPSNDWLPSG